MPRYTEAQAREAVASSRSYTEALRKLGMRPAGGNHTLFKRWVQRWAIDTSHFDPRAAGREALRRTPPPLEEVFVEHSTRGRAYIKRRLFQEGLKEPVCELCGQGEIWRGRRMALILDHINGVPDDNRLENLRIVCPNCAATLDTHCARKNRIHPTHRECARCGKTFRVRRGGQRYCSQECGSRHERGGPNPKLRRVERPPHEQLMAEIAALGWSGTGRKYGVSDNAIRKWVRQYEAQAA